MGDLSELHADHRKRMRARVKSDGVTCLADHELLEVFLFDVIPRRNTNNTAHLMLDKFTSLDKVFSATVDELVEIEGIGAVSAKYIVDSYAEFIAESEKEMLSRPLRSFEQVSNYLIFHRLRSDVDFTALVMDREMKILRVVDAQSVAEISACDEEGTKIIVAACPKLKEEIMKLALVKSELIDIILVDEFTAVSILKFPNE